MREGEEVAAAPLLRDLPLFQERGADVLKVVPFRRAQILEILRRCSTRSTRSLRGPTRGPDGARMPPIPKTIGRYDIIELVGRGGMGVLYRARDPMLERDVALKMMLVDFTMDQTARDRFQREAKAVARLQHRNIVTIHELGESTARRSS